MPDNVEITAGSGTPIKTDLVGTVHYQVIKLDGGGDGLSVPVVAGQQTMAASLPVTVASDQSAVPVSAASLPLPTGAATAALQGGGLPAALGAGGGLKVDGSGTALPVSGTVTANVAASENVIGLVGASDTVVTVTPTLDTNVYASGDLLFDSTEITNAVRANGGHSILESITVIDKADQGVAFTLLFANAATDFGTLNNAPDPDDTEAATVIGFVPVAIGDYVDLGGARVACVRNIGLMLKAGGATTSLYIAGVNGTGTPTYGASELVFQLGFLRS